MLWLVLECFQIIEVKPYFRQLHPAAVRNVAKFSNLGGCRFVSWFRRQVGIFTKKEIPVIISGSSMFNSGNGRIENTSHLVIHHPTVYTIHYISFHWDYDVKLYVVHFTYVIPLFSTIRFNSAQVLWMLKRGWMKQWECFPKFSSLEKLQAGIWYCDATVSKSFNVACNWKS